MRRGVTLFTHHRGSSTPPTHRLPLPTVPHSLPPPTPLVPFGRSPTATRREGTGSGVGGDGVSNDRRSGETVRRTTSRTILAPLVPFGLGYFRLVSPSAPRTSCPRFAATRYAHPLGPRALGPLRGVVRSEVTSGDKKPTRGI